MLLYLQQEVTSMRIATAGEAEHWKNKAVLGKYLTQNITRLYEFL